MGKIAFTSSACLLQFADEQKNTGTGQKYRLQKVLSLTVNIKHGKAVVVLKEGLKRKREQGTPGDTSDAVEHGVARFDSLVPPGTQRHFTSSKGCELACNNPHLSYSHCSRVL